MVRTKVFVGNLSFKTTEAELAKEFEAAGKVERSNIITRGSRSLGYGFVEMESEQAAEKAVQLLNKKEIDGREINVEVARPREETANGANPPRERRPRRPFNNSNGETQQQGGQGGQGGRPNNRRFRPRRQPGDGQQGGGSPAGEGAQPQSGAPRTRRPRGPPRTPKNDADRAPRTPSATTLFVANLPFSVDDTGLAKIFEGFSLKSAHVVRKRNQRSKGFGFVELNNTDEQQKAIAAVDKKQVEGRDLIVKVALTETAGTPETKDAAAEKKN